MANHSSADAMGSMETTTPTYWFRGETGEATRIMEKKSSSRLDLVVPAVKE
jgi:hypothetical protein